MISAPDGSSIELQAVSAPFHTTEDDWAMLDRVERSRAARVRLPVARERFVVTHAQLRRMLGERLGVAPAYVPLRRMLCSRCGGSHGRPVVQTSQGTRLPRRAGRRSAGVANRHSPDRTAPPAEFSLSYTEGLAVIAVGDRPIGIDVQRVPDTATAARVLTALPPAVVQQLTAAEREELRDSHQATAPTPAQAQDVARLWARAEARLKALGCGLCDRAERPGHGNAMHVDAMHVDAMRKEAPLWDAPLSMAQDLHITGAASQQVAAHLAIIKPQMMAAALSTTPA